MIKIFPQDKYINKRKVWPRCKDGYLILNNNLFDWSYINNNIEIKMTADKQSYFYDV